MSKMPSQHPGRNRRGYGAPREPSAEQEIEKRVLQVDRVARTVAGGKRIRFRALVAVGNRNGKVGIGIGKAAEVVNAVAKATSAAEKAMIQVPRIQETIPHQVEVALGSAHLILKPARVGTSIIAGGVIRSICELAGIKNIVGKILGSANKINNSKAVIEAFKRLKGEDERA